MIPKQKKHENIRNSGIFAELVKEFYFAGKVKLFFSLFIIFAIVSLSTNKTNIFRLWSREKKTKNPDNLCDMCNCFGFQGEKIYSQKEQILKQAKQNAFNV